jgi:hypothetical protein
VGIINVAGNAEYLITNIKTVLAVMIVAVATIPKAVILKDEAEGGGAVCC